MASTQVSPAHNTAAHLIGTGEFSFSEGATSAAAARAITGGWLDFGNIMAFKAALDPKFESHYGSYRGKRRIDLRINTEVAPSYKLTADEWNLKNLALMFGCDDGTNFTQPVLSATNGNALAFSSGSSASNSAKWYDLSYTTGGTTYMVRRLTTVTFSGLTEGTDFEVDLELGRVRFLTQRTSSVTPVLTAAAITSADAGFMNGLTPYAVLRRSGYGRLVCFDQDQDNKVVLDHRDFSCDVTCENLGDINGTGFSTFEITVTVTDDAGQMLVRAANA